jgi:hypothetical protein
LWGAGEAELVAEAAVCLVSVPLHQVGHRVLRAPAVHHLLRRVVRVDDVRPGHVAEKLALFQLLDRFAELHRKNGVTRTVQDWVHRAAQNCHERAAQNRVNITMFKVHNF